MPGRFPVDGPGRYELLYVSGGGWTAGGPGAGGGTRVAESARDSELHPAESLTLVVSPSVRQSGEFVLKAEEFVLRLGLRSRGERGDGARVFGGGAASSTRHGGWRRMDAGAGLRVCGFGVYGVRSRLIERAIRFDVKALVFG